MSARGHDRSSRLALEDLCRAYYGPVRAYIGRHSSSTCQAEDLTQAFFLAFVERRFDCEADPARGRFRAYLLTAVKHFLANARDRSQALKRGRNVGLVEIDASFAQVASDSSESPERAFERLWAWTVLARAMDTMARDASRAGKAAMFARLRAFMIEAPDQREYELVAKELGMTRNALGVTVHRMRERLRKRIREELADTLDDSSQVDAEMNALRHALIGN